MALKDKLKGIWKEVVMAHFKVRMRIITKTVSSDSWWPEK
jgi:hypothetical protein